MGRRRLNRHGRKSRPPALLSEAQWTRAAMATTSGSTILVVEDDSTIRRLIYRVLARAGFTVMEATGGRQAEAILHLHPVPFDLVILDIVMPDGNGLDFANHLHLTRPASPILYISGYGDS